MSRQHNHESSGSDLPSSLEERLELLRSENHTLREENTRLWRRFVALEQRNTELLHLYVASYRLHESRSREDLFTAVREIIANLVGSEEYAVYEIDPGDRSLRLLDSCGIAEAVPRRVVLGDGVIGTVALTGAPHFADPEPNATGQPMTACLPLTVGDVVVGALVIFGLLPQKERFDDRDFELLDLVADRTAMALYATRPRSVAGAENGNDSCGEH